MGVLRIHLFGMVQVSHDGRVAPETRLIHAVQGLLAYLVLHRNKAHAREVLGGIFWGEHTDARARSCLSTALWRLRQVLEPAGVARGTYLMTMGAREVGFNCNSEHWLDVAAFEAGVQTLSRSRLDRLQGSDWTAAEEAIALYRGDLLEGFYEEWALRDRERLRMLYLDGLGRLLQHYSQSEELEQAIDCGRRILEVDPLREEIHREMIRLHLRCGHRGLALQQYEACRQILAEELDVEPMEETQALYRLIAPAGNRIPSRQLRAPISQRVLPPLRSAASNLEEVREQLNRAIRLVEEESA